MTADMHMKNTQYFTHEIVPIILKDPLKTFLKKWSKAG